MFHTEPCNNYYRYFGIINVKDICHIVCRMPFTKLSILNIIIVFGVSNNTKNKNNMANYFLRNLNILYQPNFPIFFLQYM